MAEWTKEPPKVAGWYWWRFRPTDKPRTRVVAHRPFRKALMVSREPGSLACSFDDQGGEWWPIPIPAPPEEQTK